MKYYYSLVLSFLYFGLTAQVWQPLGTGVWGPNGFYPQNVTLLTTYQNQLYVGGLYETAGGNTCSGVAAWDGVGWSCVGAAAYGEINVMAGVVYKDTLYVTGSFSTIGGVSASNIAKFDGANWSPVGSGLNAQGRSLCVYNGELYVGGDFDLAGGVTAHKIAKWNDTAWSSVGLGLSDYAACMTVQNSTLYVGGNFTTADQTTVSGLAAWDGNSWSAPNGLTSLTVPVSCIASCEDTIYFSDGNNTVWQVIGSSVNQLVAGSGNRAVKSLTTIGNSLYMGFYNAGGPVGTNGMIYQPDSIFTGANIPGGGDDYIEFQNQLVSAGNITYDYVARLWVQPVAQINTERQTICDSGSMTFTNSGQQAVQSTSWQFPGGNPSTSTSASPTVVYNTPGSYSVTLIISNLAGGDTQTITNYISVEPPLAVPAITPAGTALISSSSNGNQWYDNGVAISGATGNFYTLPTTFTDTSCYSLVVTDSTGCSAKSDSICFDPTQSGVGIKEMPTSQSLSIFPNPSNGEFTVSFENDANIDVHISIIDVLGKNVCVENFESMEGTVTHSINTEKLNPGLYVLVLNANGKSTNTKIIIQ